jgi:hypothetical protein
MPIMKITTLKEDAMKQLEKKVQESLRDGTLVGKEMQPLARHMLQTIRIRPAYLKAPAPTS